MVLPKAEDSVLPESPYQLRRSRHKQRQRGTAPAGFVPPFGGESGGFTVTPYPGSSFAACGTSGEKAVTFLQCVPSCVVPTCVGELLYTGITRARQSITFLGEQRVVRRCVTREDMIRETCLWRYFSGFE